MAFRALIDAIMLAVALVGSTNFVLSPLLVDIASDFGVATARSVLLPATCATALAVVAPVVGLGFQSAGRVPVIVGGLAVYALAWGIGAVAPGFQVLLGCAALAGGAIGAVLPACYAAAADLAAHADRARVMGRIVGGWAIAFLSVVPFTLVAQAVGWRGALGGLAAAAAVLAVVVSRVDRPAVAPVPGGGSSQLLGAIREVFGDRPAMLLLGVNLIDMGAFFAVYAYLGSEIRRSNAWGASGAGLVMAAYGLGLATITFNAHWIDRVGRQRAATLALVMLGAVLPLLPWLLAVPVALAAMIAVWGFVQGSVFTAITGLATDAVPARRAVMTALLSSSTYLGVSLTTPGYVALYERAGYAAVGVVSGAACVLAGWLLARTRLRDPG